MDSNHQTRCNREHKLPPSICMGHKTLDPKAREKCDPDSRGTQRAPHPAKSADKPWTLFEQPTVDAAVTAHRDEHEYHYGDGDGACHAVSLREQSDNEQWQSERPKVERPAFVIERHPGPQPSCAPVDEHAQPLDEMHGPHRGELVRHPKRACGRGQVFNGRDQSHSRK